MRLGSKHMLLMGGLLLVMGYSGPVLAFDFFQPIQPPRSLQIIAHRGASRQAPENTAPAILHCIEDGLEWAEVDVQMTQDGHHVLAHNDPLVSLDGESLTLSEGRLQELKKVDVGGGFAKRFNGEPLLSLAECLSLAKGRINLYLDCKAIDPESFAREILSCGMERQVVVYGHLEHLHRIWIESKGRIALMAKWHPDREPDSWVATHHLAAVEIDANEISPEIATRFRELGVKVQVKSLGEWDQTDSWERTIRAGADWIQTDLPEEVLAHILWRKGKKKLVQFALHRGASRYAPENTLPAFEKAVRLGADYVEFDVRTTRDGKFYLLHNSTLEGSTNGTGNISETSSELLEKLSAGVVFGRSFAGIGLPSLEVFLASMKGRADLYFDAKAISPESLSAVVERFGLCENTVVYQSEDYLLRLQRMNPRIRSLPPLRDPMELEGIAERLNPFGVDVRWGILSEELISRCHELGIRVFSDALGDYERVDNYMEAIRWGIDVIQTDHPLRLFRAIERLQEGLE